MNVIWHSFDVCNYFNFASSSFFSGLVHYIYCSTLISTIILRVLVILLFTVIVIIINFVIIIIFIIIIIIIITIIIIIIITITNSFYLFISFNIYLYTYLLICRTIRPEGSLFGTFFNPGMLRAEGVV